MRCLIEGCGHVVRGGNSYSRKLGTHWMLHQVCNCCAVELTALGIFTGVLAYYFITSFKCKQYLRKEPSNWNKNKKKQPKTSDFLVMNG